MAQLNNLIVTGSSRHLNTIYASNVVVGALKSGTTLGTNASVFGNDNEASNLYDHAEGYQVTASGGASHAEGFQTTASGYYAHAEGLQTTAGTSYASHAEGEKTTASGDCSHAEGGNTTASGTCSHTEGYNTTANHRSQHVFGEYNIADTSTAAVSSRGNYVEIVGKGTSNNARSNARTLDWSGNEVLSGTLTTTDVVQPSGTWDGDTASLYTALDKKLPNTTKYAGSDSVGGAANYAKQFVTTVNVGDSWHPVWFNDGKPTKTMFGIRIMTMVNSLTINNFTDGMVLLPSSSRPNFLEGPYISVALGTYKYDKDLGSVTYTYNTTTHTLSVTGLGDLRSVMIIGNFESATST